MDLVGGFLQCVLLPEIRSKVGVGSLDGIIGSLGEVAEGGCLSYGGGVAIVDTGHSKKLLWNRGSDNTGTTRSRDETHPDGSALSGNLKSILTPAVRKKTTNLARDGVGLADLVTPVSTTDGDNGQLGGDDSSSDSSGDFLRALDSETNMAIVISDGDEGLEAGTLTGSSLFLDRGDLQDFITKTGEQAVDDFELL